MRAIRIRGYDLVRALRASRRHCIYSAVGLGRREIVHRCDLLEKLKDKAIEEGKTEEVSFQKFQYWYPGRLPDLIK